MADTHPVSATRPAGAPAYEPVVRLGTPPSPAIPATQTPSRINHPVLLPSDATDVDDELPAAGESAPSAAPGSHTAPRVRWYTYIASGLAGAVLVTAIYGLLGSRSGAAGGRGSERGAAGAVPVSDTALLDRRADTLALALTAFNMRATMYERAASHRWRMRGSDTMWHGRICSQGPTPGATRVTSVSTRTSAASK